MDPIAQATEDLHSAIERFEAACRDAGGYMPAIATRLRIMADELADRYPDDTNGGRRMDDREVFDPADPTSRMYENEIIE